MLKIRLMRIGAKQRPFYRVVAVDERTKRNGAYIELLGTYNPLTEPKEIKLKQDRIDYWIKQGAQLSTGYLRIIGKAPQRPPRKPKKAGKDGGGDKGQKEIKPAEEPTKPSEPETTAETADNNNVQNETIQPETSEPGNAPTAEEPAHSTTEEEKTNEGSA